LDDHLIARYRSAQSEKQSRYLLGLAGGRVFALYGEHRSSELLSEAVHGDAGTKSDRPEWQFSSGVGALQPYAYGLFNLEAMTAVCQIVSTRADNLWAFETSDGRGIRKVVEYMFPVIADKRGWFLTPDVQYFDQWPVRQPSLVFAGLAFSRAEYLKMWLSLNADPGTEEVIRNFPIRQHVLWTL